MVHSPNAHITARAGPGQNSTWVLHVGGGSPPPSGCSTWVVGVQLHLGVPRGEGPSTWIICHCLLSHSSRELDRRQSTGLKSSSSVVFWCCKQQLNLLLTCSTRLCLIVFLERTKSDVLEMAVVSQMKSQWKSTCFTNVHKMIRGNWRIR